MPRPFLTPTEKKTILQAYSMNFEREFDKMGPYTFGIPYIYVISICPEIDYDGKQTGRILVNHFRYSSKSPVFIDVWEREGEELIMTSRNLPGRNLISEAERIKVLEEELEAYKRMRMTETEALKLKGKKLSEYVREQHKYWQLSHEEMNRAFSIIHSWREDADTYFKESPYYWTLLKERDDALMELEDQNKRNKELEKRLAALTEKLLSLSQNPSGQTEPPVPLINSVRGAGRRKVQDKELQREMVRYMIEEGYSPKEICKELGIGRSTYYRYRKETDNG